MKAKLLLCVYMILLVSCSKDVEPELASGLFLNTPDSNFIYLRNATNYNYFKINARKNIMDDQFSDNAKNWPTNSEVTIEDGYYKIKSASLAWLNTPQIDVSRDFEIEYTCLLRPAFSWESTNAYEGLIYGFDNISQSLSTKFIGVGTTSNGGGNPKYIAMGEANTNTINMTQDKIFFSSFNGEGQPDKITLRKILNYYLVFVNEKLVFRVNAGTGTTGGKFGFASNGNLWIDAVKADYLSR